MAGSFDDDVNHRKFNKSAMASALMFDSFVDEIKSHDGSTVAPDTLGADYFFVTDFVNPDMEWDFDRIEEEFMKNCHSKLREFGQAQWYPSNAIRYSDPIMSHQSMVMSMILNGSKCGDEYCKALIRYLFKTYHKSLYKQLKRFNKISADEVLSLSEVGDQLDLGYMSIILTICTIDNIKMSASCSHLFGYLNKRRVDLQEEEEDSTEYLDFPDGLFAKCKEQVDEWISQRENEGKSYRSQNRKYWQTDEFVGGCLRHFGYPDDFVYRCIRNDCGLAVLYTRTLAVLKTMYPSKEFSFDDVQLYSQLYRAASALVDVSDQLDNVNELFLGLKENYDAWDDDTMFFPENIVVNETKPQEDKKTLASVATVENDEIDKDDYLAEIDSLRRKLNQREMEYNHLKSLYASSQNARKEAENILSKYENDREELIALREFAYNLENEAPEMVEISIEDMKEAIKDKAFVIVGGHVNWVNKLKSEFPKWTYVMPSAYKTVDADSLENKDMIFFFTDYLSHVAYGKCIAIARERKIPFSYLHGVNLEQIVKQIYDSVSIKEK